MIRNDYSLEELADFTPYENYITAIRDSVTKKKYAGQLEMFLNPNYDWEKTKLEKEIPIFIDKAVQREISKLRNEGWDVKEI